jgi:hypothetical protein
MLRLYPFRFLLPAFLLLLSFFALDCRTTPTGPVGDNFLPNENVPPGSHEYIWTVDTIKLNHWDLLRLSNIWGSSPTDIWAVGSADVSFNVIWHYDGKAWRTDSVHRNLASCLAICGFSSNDVWIGDAMGSLWRYTGSWSQITHIQPSAKATEFLINSLWGRSPNFILAVGFAQSTDGSYFKPALWKYNGSSWDSIATPEMRVAFSDARISDVTGDMYIYAYSYEQSSGWMNYAYIKDNSGYIKVAENVAPINVETIDNKIFFNISSKLYFYQGGGIKTLERFFRYFPV